MFDPSWIAHDSTAISSAIIAIVNEARTGGILDLSLRTIHIDSEELAKSQGEPVHISRNRGRYAEKFGETGVYAPRSHYVLADSAIQGKRDTFWLHTAE